MSGFSPPPDSHWDIRIVTAVQADTEKNRTQVTWGERLAKPSIVNPKFYALRQRASLFGYNALNPLMLTPKTRAGIASLLSGNEWRFGVTGGGTNLAKKGLIDLDAVYSKLAVGGWLVLIRPGRELRHSPSGLITLCLINSVSSISRSDYGTSAKITRVSADNTRASANYYVATRSASILTQSEELASAEQPLDHPLYGSFIDLKGVRLDLAGSQGARRLRQEPQAASQRIRGYARVRS